MATAPKFLRRRNLEVQQIEPEILADEIEQEIAQLIPRNRVVPQQPAMALPEYLEHREETPPVGRLSAQALAADFEKSAKSITKLGEELAALAIKNDEATHRVREIIEHVEQTAEWARTEAKRIFESVASSAIFAEEIRRLCDNMKQRIEAGELPPLEQKDDGPDAA